MTYVTDTTTPSANIANDDSKGARLKRARAALILIPLLFVAVVGLAMAGLGKQASVAEENSRPAVTEPADQGLIDAIDSAIPEDVSRAKRAEILEAVEATYEPEEDAGKSEREGSMLGLLLMVFVLVSLIVFVTGIWMLLARRAPRSVRGAGLVAMPLMVLSGLSAMGLSFVALNVKPEEKKRPFNTLAVMADYARQDDVQLSVTTQGETRPKVEIDLVPEVGGKIVYVSPNFIEGGIFRRGETLARIDPSDFETAVVSAEANVANAQQALSREIAEGQIALSDLEDFGVTDASGLARRQPQRQQAEAAVKAAQAELDRAKLQLARTSVRAPFAGRVNDKTADLGQFVSPGSRLGRIFSTDVVEVRLPLTDADLAKLDIPIAFFADSRESAPEVTLSASIAGKRREWEARIMRTDATYDTQTRALFAFAEVLDPYGKGSEDAGVPLAPGLFVDATIQGLAIEDVIVLPRSALRPGGEVYVVDDKGKAEIRTASVIDTNAERAVLQPGAVAAGEIVVVSPMERSRTEVPLKVLDVNNPRNVLVEPPKPDWMKRRDGEAESESPSRSRDATDDGSSDMDDDEEDADTADIVSNTDNDEEGG